MAQDLRAEFIRFCVDAGILTFGEFETKAGRLSPYFFNAGMFNDGLLLQRVAHFYAKTILAAEKDHGLKFDLLFGPAYKGITLASATAVELARMGRNTPFAFNRKEAKDHGEGGSLVGAPVVGRALIVDDVVSAGTSVRESIELIGNAGGEPVGVLIALDRQERSGTATELGQWSAVQEIRTQTGLDVFPIATLSDLLRVLENDANTQDLAAYRSAVAAYQKEYGASYSDQ